MPRTGRAAALLVPALLAAVLTGCGDDAEPSGSGLTADEQTAADNLTTQIVRSGSVSGQDSGPNAVTETQAECIGEGAVTEVGLESLQGYGIVTEELRVDRSIQGVRMSAEDADAFAGVLIDCIDAEALFEERFLTMLAGAGGPAPEPVRACVRRAISEEPVRTILSASFQGDGTTAYARLRQRVTACAEGPSAEK